MSLVNDMLNDLDVRRRSQAQDEINLDWMSGQKNTKKNQFFLPVLWLVALLALLFIAYQLWQLNSTNGLAPLDYLAAGESVKKELVVTPKVSPLSVSDVPHIVDRDKRVKRAEVAAVTTNSASKQTRVISVNTQKLAAKPVVDVANKQEQPLVHSEIAKPSVSKTISPAANPIKSKRLPSSQQQDQKNTLAADKLLKMQRFTEAENLLVNFMQANPLALRSGEKLVSLWLLRQDYERAQSMLSRLRDANPRHIGLIQKQSRLFLLTGRVDESVALLMSEKPPLTNHADYYELLGLASRQNKQYQLSAQAYRGLLEYDSSRGDWWVGMAIALDLSGKTDRARDAYRQAVKARGLSAALRDYAQQRLSVL